VFALNLIKNREISFRRRQALIGFIGIYCLVLGLTIVLMASWCVGKWVMAGTREHQISALKTRIADARKRAGSRAKEPSLSELVAPLKNARGAVRRRTLWSQKLDALCEAVPERLWVSELRVEKEKIKPGKKPPKKPRKEKTAHADSPGKDEPPKEMVQRTLVVQGYARAGHTAAAELVSGLAERLAQDDRFMDGLAKVESISINPSPVREDQGLLIFELRCPFVGDEGDG